MKRKFEEVLEESLSALLEGRRSINQSASLYPDLAAELVPLLRTASGVSGAFENLDPTSNIAERGRLRFLAAASERRRARQIAGGVWGFHRTRLPWNFRQWGLLGAGVAAAFAALVAGAVMLAAGGEDNGSSFVDNHTPTPASAEQTRFAANLTELRAALNWAKVKAQQGTVSPEDIRSLREATNKLRESGEPPDNQSRQETERALSDQLAFVIDQSKKLPDEQQDDLQGLASDTQKAADDLGVVIPPIFTAQPTPPPTEMPTPTLSPTETPPPATDTPSPTEEPTPTPTPLPLQGLE